MRKFPVQHRAGHYTLPREIPEAVHLRAYEVYCEVYGPQEELTRDRARGGFSTGELVSFLYARSFPKEEWRQRFYECFRNQSI